MKEKLTFIELLFKDLLNNFNEYLGYKKIYERERKEHLEGRFHYYPHDGNYMNKNHGKVALRRKIIYLRQELLNLERMLDS